MMVQRHRETCVDPVEGILCIQDPLHGNDDVLKDDILLGQVVVPVQVRDVTCQLVENPGCLLCRFLTSSRSTRTLVHFEKCANIAQFEEGC